MDTLFQFYKGLYGLHISEKPYNLDFVLLYSLLIHETILILVMLFWML